MKNVSSFNVNSHDKNTPHLISKQGLSYSNNSKYKIIKRFSTFVLLLFLSITANAQSNYRPGYIITNSNDTIKGLIDFRTDKINSSHCRFKLSKDAEEQTFYPNDIQGYMFTNEVKFYVTRTIDMNGAPEKVFLEYLVQGIKDLYFYPKDNGYYYIEDENGKMIAVTKDSEKIEGNKYVTDKKYIGLLKYVFRDAESVTKEVEKKGFNRANMIELTKDYHDKMCTSGEKCIIFTNDYKKKFIKFGFGIYGGLQLTEYSFKYTRQSFLNSTKSLNPSIGGMLSINSPRLMKSLSLIIDASLTNIKGEGDYSNGPDFYEKYTINSLAAATGIGLKYTYSERKLRPTIEAGVGYSVFVTNSNSFCIEIKTPSGTTSETTHYFRIPINYYGYNCGIGLDYKANAKHLIFFKLLYNKLIDRNGKISGIQLKIGYTL